jgi:proteasome lid subunit RPN8/RPN11
MNNFPDGSEENTFSQRRLPSSDSTDQIIWTERKDVYRPILQSIDDFTRRRGIPRSGYNEVFFSIEALETLTRHLDTNLQIEQGGILFGNAYQDSTYGIYVEITAAVPAPQTIGTVAHLEFTPDSWLSIMNYARAQHPTENLVGWYHSHPNHGVFMSGVDMRVCRSYVIRSGRRLDTF